MSKVHTCLLEHLQCNRGLGYSHDLTCRHFAHRRTTWILFCCSEFAHARMSACLVECRARFLGNSNGEESPLSPEFIRLYLAAPCFHAICRLCPQALSPKQRDSWKIGQTVLMARAILWNRASEIFVLCACVRLIFPHRLLSTTSPRMLTTVDSASNSLTCFVSRSVWQVSTFSPADLTRWQRNLTTNLTDGQQRRQVPRLERSKFDPRQSELKSMTLRPMTYGLKSEIFTTGPLHSLTLCRSFMSSSNLNVRYSSTGRFDFKQHLTRYQAISGACLQLTAIRTIYFYLKVSYGHLILCQYWLGPRRRNCYVWASNWRISQPSKSLSMSRLR